MLGPKTQLRTIQTIALCVLAVPVALICAHTLARGEVESRGKVQQEPISISSTFAQSWQQERETVHLLRGRCQIIQGGRTLRSERMVVWRRLDSQSPARERVTVYLEEGVRVDEPGNTLTERTLMLDLSSQAGVKLQAERPTNESPGTDDPTYRRALARRTKAGKGPVRQVQFQSADDALDPELRSLQLQPPTGGIRRVRVFSRSGGGLHINSQPSPNTTPPEQVVIVKGGVNVLIEGAEQQGPGSVGPIDLTADEVVFWTDEASAHNFGGEMTQPQEMPLQVYLEGNVVVRQGMNVLRANQAFYDVREDRALLLDADIRTSAPGINGKVRVHAQRLRQLARDTYQAQQAFITTSEFVKPGYRLQASEIFIEPRPDTAWWSTEEREIDPVTGEPIEGPTLWATSLNNTFFVESVPVFYFPYLSAPAEDPNIPLRDIQFQSDRIFGQTIRTRWDIFKLTGLDRPQGTRWDLNLNYLSLRGPQTGTLENYRGVGRFGLDGPYSGAGYTSFIYDHGHDNLGNDRLNLTPPQKSRGGLLHRDRQDFSPDTTLLSEISFLSDRNWLEQYREQEFDTGKDYETQLYLRHLEDNWSWTAMGRARLYDYYNTTEWLPRGDLFGLAEPLLGGAFTWSSHTYAGYANQQIANQPTDPLDLYTVLPFEGNGSGLVASTRHEIDMPFQLGPINFVPYALGEDTYWGDAFHNVGSTTPLDGRIFSATQINEGALNRLYGTLGMRGSFEMWRTFPQVQSELFNLNGMAHKMVFDANYSFSESTQPLSAVPQYNEFDDNAQEQFRRRLLVNTWGGTLPGQFDPRFFAVRSGTGSSVTAPYNELVDNMNVLRMGWRHRLQTKVGPVNAPRIKNWMTLDLETSFFPDYNRDNFGTPFGLYSARYNWYAGDRTTVTASTLFDTFDNPERLWSLGVNSQRSTRGSVYVGIRDIQGGSVLHSEILTASYSYVMSPKWISSVGTAYDLGEHMNRGQTVQITRVGADFLMNFGVSVDPTKNNFGVAFSIQPRFARLGGNNTGQGTQLGSLLGGTPGMGMGPSR